LYSIPVLLIKVAVCQAKSRHVINRAEMYNYCLSASVPFIGS